MEMKQEKKKLFAKSSNYHMHTRHKAIKNWKSNWMYQHNMERAHQKRDWFSHTLNENACAQRSTLIYDGKQQALNGILIMEFN